MIFHPVAITVPFRGVTISSQTALAERFFSRLKGLLGMKQFSPGSALIIKSCSTIHTVGMKFPIDVLFVDKQGRISKMYYGVKPGRIVSGGLSSVMAVELPQGTIDNTSISTGDRISLT